MVSERFRAIKKKNNNQKEAKAAARQDRQHLGQSSKHRLTSRIFGKNHFAPPQVLPFFRGFVDGKGSCFSF